MVGPIVINLTPVQKANIRKKMKDNQPNRVAKSYQTVDYDVYMDLLFDEKPLCKRNCLMTC